MQSPQHKNFLGARKNQMPNRDLKPIPQQFEVRSFAPYLQKNLIGIQPYPPYIHGHQKLADDY
jgi:hypothetical protein